MASSSGLAPGQLPGASSGASTSRTTVAGVGVEPCKISRHNGVVFNAKSEIPIHEYIKGLTSVVQPAQIVSASRISNSRIAVYLRNKDTVAAACQAGLSHKGSFIEITPLVLPSTKVILSNVFPELPNAILEKQISTFGKIVSKIHPITLGFKEKNLAHITSFRRQVQVMFNPNVTPPSHIDFAYEGSSYRVFISTEAARCFTCNEVGHMSRDCKKDNKSENRGKVGPKNHPKSSKPNPLPQPNVQGSIADNRDSAPPKPPSSSSVWGTPPRPTRLFSDVVTDSKRKQSLSNVPKKYPGLVSLTSPTPPRKMRKRVSSPMETVSPSQITDSPSPANVHPDALKQSTSASPSHSGAPLQPLSAPQTPTPSPAPMSISQSQDLFPTPTRKPNDPTLPPSTPSSTASGQDPDTDPNPWEESFSTDDESADWASSFPSSQGPLSNKELIKFVRVVKSRKKPLEVAHKFTNNISGLTRQLMPLRNSPLFKKSTQVRVQKLIRKLEECTN